ncbi:FAD-dependent oxidoreductase [Aspergillus undulatus]|uniref:FAD monooxygenase n=1 Tax=Emericella variicolor TaxID=1549217 RepID=A0A6J4A2F3_EMEVA|nr:FAD monooxygenase [Aspergillus stellatus]
MSISSKDSGLRIIIIGGGITGLALAHFLEHAGINFVLLEKHHDILANFGGSVGLQANGCRILEQVGVYEHLEQWMTATEFIRARLPDGFTWVYPSHLYTSMLGYPLFMIRRTVLLRCLYDSLKDQSKIKVGSKVLSITRTGCSDGPLSVTTAEGAQYTGDIVVGADGVHGITRAEMWRLAEPQLSEPSPEHMTVDYMCILGITQPVESLAEMIRMNGIYGTFYKHVVWIVIPNKDNSVNWSALIKLDRTYAHPNVPKWSQEEVMTRLEALEEHTLDGTLKFRAFWEITESISSVPIYEGIVQTTTLGRIVCIGDNVFKMSPYLAEGGNLCLESAAILANTLRRLNTPQTKHTEAEISAGLRDSTAAHMARLRRRCAESYVLARTIALETWTGWFWLRYFAKYTATSACYYIMTFQDAGPTLDYLPMPTRARLASKRLEQMVKKRRRTAWLSCGVAFGVISLSFLWFLS